MTNDFEAPMFDRLSILCYNSISSVKGRSLKMNKETIIRKINQLQKAQENIEEYIDGLKITLKFFQAITAISQAEVDKLKAEIVTADLARWKVTEYQRKMRDIAFDFSIKNLSISDLIVT